MRSEQSTLEVTLVCTSVTITATIASLMICSAFNDDYNDQLVLGRYISTALATITLTGITCYEYLPSSHE